MFRTVWCLKCTSHTGEHSLIPTRCKDGLGLDRQVAMTIDDQRPEIEAMVNSLHLGIVCMALFINMVTSSPCDSATGLICMDITHVTRLEKITGHWQFVYLLIKAILKTIYYG